MTELWITDLFNYGMYVWIAYALTAVILLMSYWIPQRRLHRYRKNLLSQ